MNREALLTGVVALVFGLSSYQLQGEADGFVFVQLGIAAVALVYGVIVSLRSAGKATRQIRLGSVYRVALMGLLAVSVAIAAERIAASSNVRFDLTFEGEYNIAPATTEALGRLDQPVAFTLYFDPGDPRIRRTRLLLEAISVGRDIPIGTRSIEESPDDEDRFAIGSSNTVVIQHGSDWRRVDRPTEGALFEAMAELAKHRDSILYIATGTGEGDINDGTDAGYSGLAVAFQTDGFDVRVLPSAVMGEIPEDADVVVVLGPQRKMRDGALDALARYVKRGGSLLAFIEPGVESGLEALLADFGLRSPDALIIDPVSDPVDGDIGGVSPIVFNYATHPVTEGLKTNRNTVFRRARSFDLRKPKPEDRLKALVYTSPYAWRHVGPLPIGEREPPQMPDDIQGNYHHLVVSARYPRGDHEGRIVAFGDRDFASNRYLRALYNLDLVMNAAHWAVARTDRITLRPKSAGLIQFPVPIVNSMKAFYGVGLLIPEILVILGGITWLRSRQA
ncbi:MAG: Gldg family protein [Myxococcota bacterium]|nr:Gldg family protein [Myxococcota bacterium]